jgi:hypothetical protein
MSESSSEIPESRELSTDERALVRWLIEHAAHDASSYLGQVDQLRVCSRCGCGCASLNFNVGEQGWPAKVSMKVVSDQDWTGADGCEYGIFLFDHGGTLAGIDVHSLAAPTVPDRLPAIAELERTLAIRARAAQPAVATDGTSRRR